jgi:hypothetical protein
MDSLLTVVTICVDYSDILALTLPWTIKWAERIVIGTAPQDAATQELCKKYGVHCYVSDAFYLDGAIFNKGRVIERIFDATGRRGWYLVLDADIVCKAFPDFQSLDPTCLYSIRRRMLIEIAKFAENPDMDWSSLPLVHDQELAGYFHLFSSTAPVCQQLPWYGVTWKHAGGCDSEFERKWPREKKIWLPGEVLHLGPHGNNWCGRITPLVDGSMLPESEKRRAALHDLMQRRQRRDLPRYYGEKIDGLASW